MLKTLNVLKRQLNLQNILVRHYPYAQGFLEELDHGHHANVSKLANGILVGSLFRDTPHTTIGIYYGAGSRFESLHENGIMNLFIHAVYKGTKAKTAEAVNNEMLKSGALFKCVVEREIVGITATCLHEDANALLDLMVDCIYNNLFDAKLLEAAATQVCQAAKKGEFDSGQVIYDYLHNIAFLGCGLANPIIGPMDLLATFNETSINNYLCRAISTDRTAVVAVGNTNHEALVTRVNCLMGCFDLSCKCASEYYRYNGGIKMYRDDSMPKCDVAIGFEAPCYCDTDHFALDIAGEIIGGWDKSQPAHDRSAAYLAQAASSEHIADCYMPFNFIYSDAGLFGVRFISSPTEVDDMTLNLMHKLREMCVVVHDGEAARGRRQLKAKILADRMSTRRTLDSMARDLIYKKQTKSLMATMKYIDSISGKRIAAVCHHYMYDRCPAVAGIGRTEGIPEYNRLRSGTWSLLY